MSSTGNILKAIFPIPRISFRVRCGSHVTSRDSRQILKKESLLVGYNTRTFPLTPVVQQSITLLTALLLACVACVHPPPPAVFREL